MKCTPLVLSCLLLLPPSLWASSFYCPENHAYISIGMSELQVTKACGDPVSKKDSNQPVIKKIPATQLVYNNEGTKTGFYGVWNIPMGSGGLLLQVTLVNNKVQTIEVNGSNSNSVSICKGVNIQPGDPAGKVYSACGNPSTVNQTFITQMVPTQTSPKLWLYQFNQYQKPVVMTFVNGKLHSIQQ